MRVYLDTVGCRLNQAEIEMIAQQFAAAGHILVSEAEEADLAVLNTCTVTAKAAADSRSQLRRLERSGVKQIILTGCWASIHHPDADDLVKVGQIIPNLQKDRLVDIVLNQLNDQAADGYPFTAAKPVVYRGLSGKKHRTRAFIKVQDGCDDHCTFCITRIARGPSRSRSLDQVLEDVRQAIARGVKEVVLSGVQLAAWGRDLHDLPSSWCHLRFLVEAIMEHAAPPRLRLSSLEAWHLDPSFFSLWQDERICRHVHLPLQSGCDATLKRMGRHMQQRTYAQLVEAALQQCPDLAITTDIIVGFSGETEAEFSESLAFVREMNFAGGHVFTYSERQGTPAAALPNAVPIEVRKQRNAEMRQVLAQSSFKYRRRFIGSVRSVLWERAIPIGTNPEENERRTENREEDSSPAQAVPTALENKLWKMVGLTDNYLRVEITSFHNLWNQITNLRLDETNLKLG